MKNGWLVDDELRVATLREYGIMDTPPEAAYDALTASAAKKLNAPAAIVNIIGADHQWFKARFGTDMAVPTIEQSICVHCLAEGGELVIGDLTTDDRTRELPCVLAEPRLRFYAGAPIVVDGQALGALAVLDVEPRPEGITPSQTTALKRFAMQIAALIEEGDAPALQNDRSSKAHLNQ